jgi:hypothetical protein
MSNLRLGDFALQLAAAFQSWHSAAGEPAGTYFAGSPQRHGGDELTIRSSLIKDHLLHQGFGYAASDIEIEAPDRSDIVLYSGTTERRPVVVVETKRSGFGDLLQTVQANGETPPQQLERYLRMRGMYLGALTNGETWHIIDIGVGLEPRASFSLLHLLSTLAGATTADQAEQRLTGVPGLRNALLIAQRLLEASKWATVEYFLTELSDITQFQSKQLTAPADHAGLIQQIRQELSILRDTILAQFTLLRDNFTAYQERADRISEDDDRSYTHVLDDLCVQIVQSLPEASMRPLFSDLLDRLITEFAQTGNNDWFYATYITEGQQIVQATYEQLSLSPEMAVPVAPAQTGTRLPSIEKLLTLLVVHRQYMQRLERSYASSIRLERSYREWRQRVRGVFAAPDEEFCLQTSYIHFVRLFFARVCEDYALIQRRISNGPFSQFDEYRRALLQGISDVYIRLLDETFERAASVYHNFFNRDDLYDWFKLDERSILGLLTVLNRYDFSQITVDVLGTIYNEGYIVEQRRSELGQFYTPHQVVTYMIDALGIPRPDPLLPVTPEERQIIQQSVIDLSCGSGSFLVEIASRKAAVLRKLVDTREVSPEDAVEYITGRIVGIDINPFACYLAEINLFIRCMPFLQRTLPGGQTTIITVQRLSIFCSDALEPTRRELVQYHLYQGGITRMPPLSPPSRLTEEERLTLRLKDDKTLPNRFGNPGSGFDIVIGNPPYVRADESVENREYRNKIREWGIYNLRAKWDLFVPFVYRNLQFLATGGHMTLITTNAIETEGYATELRNDLIAYKLEQIDFFPKIKLFEGVGVHNTIFRLRNQQQPGTTVRQRIHQDSTCANFQEQTRAQAVGPDELFRHAYVAPPTGIESCTLPLCAVAYIGTGLEAHSHEQRSVKFDLSQSFRETLVGLAPDEQLHFTDRGVLGEEVQEYRLLRQRYVAYDYMKDNMRRPRIPELFRTPHKLLLGETSGGYYDTDQLFANHSVQVVVPWHVLQVDRPGVRKVRRNSEALSGFSHLDTIAQAFDLRYVLAIINSNYMRHYLLTNKMRGTRTGRIYPDVWKEMPVKVVSAETQTTIATMVDDIQVMYCHLVAMPTDNDIFQSWQQQGRITGYLKDYVTYGYLEMVGNLEKTRKGPYNVTGNQVILYGTTGLMATNPEYLPILHYFCWYCNDIAPQVRGYDWEMLRSQIPLPARVDQVNVLLTEVAAVRQERANQETDIAAKREAIEQAVKDAYESGCDNDLWEELAALRNETETAQFAAIDDETDNE